MAKNSIDWSPGNWPKLLYQFFTSFKLATTVLFLMLLVTLFGTLDQVDNGLPHSRIQRGSRFRKDDGTESSRRRQF